MIGRIHMYEYLIERCLRKEVHGLDSTLYPLRPSIQIGLNLFPHEISSGLRMYRFFFFVANPVSLCLFTKPLTVRRAQSGQEPYSTEA